MKLFGTWSAQDEMLSNAIPSFCYQGARNGSRFTVHDPKLSVCSRQRALRPAKVSYRTGLAIRAVPAVPGGTTASVSVPVSLRMFLRRRSWNNGVVMEPVVPFGSALSHHL